MREESKHNEYYIKEEDFKKLMHDVSTIKKQAQNNDIPEIKQQIKELSNNQSRLSKEQNELKNEVSSLRDSLLNPEEGIVVKVNKNTEYRNKMSKALWVLLVAIIGLIVNSVQDIT